MRLKHLITGFVAIAVCLFVGCQGISEQKASSPSQSPGGQLLYVSDRGRITTYSTDPSSLDLTVVGSAVNLIDASSSVLQLVPSADDQFLYVLWSDKEQQEHLSVFATDASGIPQIPPIQILDVSSLSQLNVHPSGQFAYAMSIETSAGMYTSTILLFHAAASGILQLDPEAQGVYGPASIPTLLYGLSPDGKQLYVTSEDENGSAYWQRAINQQTGTLSADVLLLVSPFRDSVAFGATVIIDYQSALSCSEPRSVNVFANKPEPSRQLIHCGSDMLDACGTATDVQVDPSGQYLFLTDPTSQKVRVAYIDLSKNVVADTGNFIPFTMQTPGFAFSPDGTLVYALLACDCSLHVYRFDQTSGHLTEGASSIPMTNSSGFLPARHQ
jgi:6-phosphogluconolactonase (cycloisomerase 2 family)